MLLTKRDIKRIFLTQKACAEAMGISQQAISYWPEPIPQRRSDEIIGAAIRQNLHIAPDIIAKHQGVESKRG